MYTLGIETSCDETSAAVVRNNKVLSCKTLSSLQLHAKYGGVIPEIASRRQIRFIDQVTEAALDQAGIGVNDLDLVAVTKGPGLIGSLLVGRSFAESLSFSLGLPLLGIDHLHAHLFAAFLGKKISFPFLGLVASGGHTQIYKVLDFNRIKLLTQTRDDACGEALDKVGRFYGLGFPAGPRIDRLYSEEAVDKAMFRMKAIGEFSFSGIKTKAVYMRDRLHSQGQLTRKQKIAILSSFQYAVIDSLINNLTIAVKKFKISCVVCGGGVVANRLLRRRLEALKRTLGVRVYLPQPQYCQDNAACVAGLGEYLFSKRRRRG